MLVECPHESDAQLLERTIDDRLYRHVISEMKYSDGTVVYPDKANMCAWRWVVTNPDGTLQKTE